MLGPPTVHKLFLMGAGGEGGRTEVGRDACPATWELGGDVPQIQVAFIPIFRMTIPDIFYKRGTLKIKGPTPGTFPILG